MYVILKELAKLFLGDSVKLVTLPGTDIEQGIYEAIVATLGQMSSNMWFGNSARIDVHESGVRIHAVNTFAADWVGKNHLSAIQSRCRPYLKKGQRIEIVSVDCDPLTDASPGELERRTLEHPLETTRMQPRFSTEILLCQPSRELETQRFSDVLVSLPTHRFSGGLLDESDKVTCHVFCEKEVTIPISANGDGGQKKKNERKKSSKTAATSTPQPTPQEWNEQIIAKGKDRLAGMTLPAPARPVAKYVPNHPSAGVSPALKRDEANRNVVFVADKTNNGTKGIDNNALTWNNFVVGASNRLAVRAADLVIHHSGQISPIYIFGPTSVGKTHLLEAIKASFRRIPQAKPLVMMTAEQFTSSFIDALPKSGSGGNMPSFRNKFRGISALLVDDVQFFVGKDSTQTEFLRTIDHLKSQGVQIVFTGDRPLNSLADLLKPEIIARLEAGMSCEIKPADHEMLLAIFKQMAASRNIKLADDVCEYVVSRLATHARQLSGAINRLHAAMLTSKRPITLETVENILEDMIRNNRRPVRLHDIEKAVCETMQLSGQLLQSKSRAKQATQPRMLAMWLARKYTRSALSEIGKYFGNRSHSTVVSAQKKVDQWLRESPDFGLANSPFSVAEVIQKVEVLMQTH